jgi:flagellin FlaB
MMRLHTSDDGRFTGLEAAIVLIAFVVIAAIFSYVVGITTPKSLGVFNTGAEPADTIRVIGDVYGLAAVPSSGINEIRFSIRLVPGAPSMNLTTMAIVFSTPATSPVTLSQGTNASASIFTTRLDGGGKPVSSIDPDQQVELDFFVADVPANTRMNFDLRPPAGALSFSRTAPATITTTNIL